MKIGIRIPSPAGRIAARLSPARAIRHRLGLKAPRPLGWLTAPQRALRGRVYSRLTIDAGSRSGAQMVGWLAILAALAALVIWAA